MLAPGADPNQSDTPTGTVDRPGITQAPTQAASSSFGHPVYDQIGNIFKSAYGPDYTPTFADVSQWGTNVDSKYMNSIQNAIYNTDPAKQYAAKQNQPKMDDQQPAQSIPATGTPVSATGGIPPAPSGPQLAPQPALGSVPKYDPYQYSNPNLPAYQAPSQVLDSASQGNVDKSNALLSAILQNPETMNPSVVAQMKEAQKEQALLMQNQTIGQNTGSAVARGTLGSGFTAGQNENVRDQAISNILTGNRNTDITAAQTNRQNQLDALNAGNANSQSALQRAIAGEGFKQAASQSSLANAGFNLNREQAQSGENYKAIQDQIQRILAQNSMNLDWSKFGEQQREFNNQLGFNYNSLDQNGQTSLLQLLLGGS